MLSIFDLTTEVPLDGGKITLVFRTPKINEVAEANALIADLQSEKDQTRLADLLNTNLPLLLSRALVGCEIAGTETPPNWREEILSRPYLSGQDGMTILQRVFFRPHCKDESEGTA